MVGSNKETKNAEFSRNGGGYLWSRKKNFGLDLVEKQLYERDFTRTKMKVRSINFTFFYVLCFLQHQPIRADPDRRMANAFDYGSGFVNPWRRQGSFEHSRSAATTVFALTIAVAWGRGWWIGAVEGEIHFSSTTKGKSPSPESIIDQNQVPSIGGGRRQRRGRKRERGRL